MKNKSNVLGRLKKRWNLKSMWDVWIVLLVFALTGFTVMFIKTPLLNLWGPEVSESTLFQVLYYILILPIYNIILLVYGFIFGRFTFFWQFEKKMLARITRRK